MLGSHSIGEPPCYAGSLLTEPSSDVIVVFRLNRPQARNALNLEVRVTMRRQAPRDAADPAIRCLIVTSSDTIFTAIRSRHSLASPNG